MTVKECFKEALDRMWTEGEFTKLAKYAKTKEEAKAIFRYADALTENKAEKLPLILLIQNATESILKDVIYYMIQIEAEETGK